MTERIEKLKSEITATRYPNPICLKMRTSRTFRRFFTLKYANDIKDIRIEKSIADTFARFILPKIREYYQSNEDDA